jgi:hypothetical protein
VDGVKGLVRLAAVAGDDEDFRHASNLTLLPRRNAYYNPPVTVSS